MDEGVDTVGAGDADDGGSAEDAGLAGVMLELCPVAGMLLGAGAGSVVELGLVASGVLGAGLGLVAFVVLVSIISYLGNVSRVAHETFPSRVTKDTRKTY